MKQIVQHQPGEPLRDSGKLAAAPFSIPIQLSKFTALIVFSPKGQAELKTNADLDMSLRVGVRLCLMSRDYGGDLAGHAAYLKEATAFLNQARYAFVAPDNHFDPCLIPDFGKNVVLTTPKPKKSKKKTQ